MIFSERIILQFRFIQNIEWHSQVLISFTVVCIIESSGIKFNIKGTTWKKSTAGIRKYFEMADNENTRYHNLCDMAKVLL